MDFDKRTGKRIDDKKFETDIIASIYDDEGNYYLIGENSKIYLKKDDNEIIEVTDSEKIAQIFHLFRSGKTDVYRT